MPSRRCLWPRSPSALWHGSGALVRWLLEHEPVDEINLLTFPLIIGQGTRLFADAGPDVALDLVDTRTTPNGVTIQVFRASGATGVRNVHREGKLATKLGVEQDRFVTRLPQ